MQSSKSKVAVLISLCLASTFILFAQKNKLAIAKEKFVPLKPERWKVDPEKAEFTTYKNVPAIKLKGSQAVLKDFVFTNGTIEFDTEPGRGPFVTMYFRYQDQKENECFYLRLSDKGSLQRNDAIQYAPFVDGVNLWDMLPHYQAPAPLNNTDWNHIKLVVSGLQMRAFVNDMTKPALQIPRLEGNAAKGTIVFEGSAAFANLIIKPDATENLSPAEGIDLTDHDANFIRHWQVTPPIDLPNGRELFKGDFMKEGTSWQKIAAERRGLINVTRKFGASSTRRYVWLKAKIKSVVQREVKIDLGFSDEVWVFVNGNLTHADKNIYLENIRKYPFGRLSIENSSFIMPLKEGENELLIGLANDFYGWGFIARLQDMEGIEFVEE
jgi:hypothetical protein